MADNHRSRMIENARRLRKPQTPLESKLWQRLRAGQIGGFKFRRQHVIGSYIADFCCEEAKLVIEIDGDTHVKQEAYDANRT